MIELRDFKESDIEPIDDIFNRQSRFGVPSLKNVIENATIVKDGQVIGYGTIKVFAEGVMLLDPDIDKKDKAVATRKAVTLMTLLAKDAGLEILYVIASSSSFSEILRKQYGFKAVPGELLMLDLTPEEK